MSKQEDLYYKDPIFNYKFRKDDFTKYNAKPYYQIPENDE